VTRGPEAERYETLGIGRMKRFFIFLLLGPLLGYLAGFIAVTLPENSFLILLIITLPLLPYVYLVGVGPALIVSMLDASLERRAFRWRIAACAIAGYAGSYAVFLFGPWMRGVDIILWGISGLVAGAVCSWLSGKRQPEPLVT